MTGLSSITINKSTSGLGRRAINRDKVSGFIFFIANGNLPSGFTVNTREKKVYSLAEAVALGITEAGANSAVHWYHIREYFRMQPEGELWIGYYPVQVAFLYPELATFINATNGECRQIGIFNADSRAWTIGDITAIQTALDGMDAAFRQTSILFAPDFAAITAVTGWGTIGDSRALTAPKVTPVIAESGSGKGLALSVAKAYSITAIGTALGCVSKAAVQQSIGNPLNFPISDGSEMETLALANGDLLSALTLTVLGALKDKGYLIARKYLPDYSGSYFERVPTAVAATNDYAWLETNRTVDKAIRAVRTAYTPALQGTIYLESDGTMTDHSVGYFKDLGQAPLDQMIADGELSAGQVLIDPAQNVTSTSRLVVSLELLLVGIAEQITVNINLVTSLS